MKNPIWKRARDHTKITHYWEDDIDQDTWNKKYLWKIAPPRPYWDSPEQRVEFMEWIEERHR